MDYYCAPQKERSHEEELIFERTLRYISHLFLGSSILILCDRTYTTRFWTLFEAWLAMQMTSANGLVPAPPHKRRCDIVPIHLASDVTAKELERLMADKSVDEAYSTLDSPDINVTNQKDKGQQLTKLLALDAQVSEAMQARGASAVEKSAARERIHRPEREEPSFGHALPRAHRAGAQRQGGGGDGVGRYEDGRCAVGDS